MKSKSRSRTFTVLQNWLKKSMSRNYQKMGKKELKILIKSIGQQKLKLHQQKIQFGEDSSIYLQSIQIDYFVEKLSIILDQHNQTLNSNIDLLLQIIKLKPKSIIQTIKNQLSKPQNVIAQIIQKVWYPYIAQKYKKFNPNKKAYLFKKLKQDIEFMKLFLADSIYFVFQSWFGNDQQQKKNIYNNIIKFIPILLTSFPFWKSIYQKLFELLPDRKIPIKVNPTAQLFQIGQNFNCSQLQKPFFQTISILKQFYDQSNIQKKLNKLKIIPQKIRQEIKQHQNRLIQKNKIKQYQLIDIDNIVACFQYCLCLLGKGLFSQNLLYFQLFYDEQFLFDTSVSYVIACLKSAAQTLINRDERGKIRLGRKSMIQSKRKSSFNPSQHEFMNLGFDMGFKFNNCFEYFTNYRIKCIEPSFISIYSQQMLPKNLELRVKIYNAKYNCLMIGIGCKQELLKSKQKYNIENEYSITYFLKSGQIFDRGISKQGNKPKLDKINMVIVKLQDNKIKWILEDQSFCEVDYQHLLKKNNIYLHIIMAYQTQIQIFYN